MKTPLVSLLTTFFLLPYLWALPQDFGDLTDLFGGGLAADGRDLTSGFLAAAVWRGEAELPGKWRDAYEVGVALGAMGGKKMIEAYNAVAREGGMRMSRSTKLDGDRVRASLEEGIPVVVWRRFDVQRNRLHTGIGGRGQSGVFASLPEPDEAERAAWPGKEAPAHASVITGFHPGRNEVIFSDSWGEHARDKRMRVEELEATAYYAFYFSL